VLAAEARELRGHEHCELVILVAHAGLECDSPGACQREGDHAEILHLLKALPAGTFDAVVAGHTGQLAQEMINGTPVLQAGSEGGNVGVLRLWKEGPVTHSRFEPFIAVPAESAHEQADVTAVLKNARAQADELKTRMVGYAASPLTHHYNSESALGNLIADALLAAGRELGHADFALINSGGIRSSLPAGRLSYGDVYRVFPYENSLTVVELTGAELRLLIEIAESGGHGISPVSGLIVRRLDVAPGQRGPWDRDLDHNGRTEDWERNLVVGLTDAAGHPIRDDARYRLATYNFLSSGGDHQNLVYSKLPPGRIQGFSQRSAREALAAFLLMQGEIAPETYFNPTHPRVTLVKP
jgi:5'-nucleotidase